jgi:hypothetical protein
LRDKWDWWYVVLSKGAWDLVVFEAVDIEMFTLKGIVAFKIEIYNLLSEI